MRGFEVLGFYSVNKFLMMVLMKCTLCHMAKSIYFYFSCDKVTNMKSNLNCLSRTNTPATNFFLIVDKKAERVFK